MKRYEPEQWAYQFYSYYPCTILNIAVWLPSYSCNDTRFVTSPYELEDGSAYYSVQLWDGNHGSKKEYSYTTDVTPYFITTYYAGKQKTFYFRRLVSIRFYIRYYWPDKTHTKEVTFDPFKYNHKYYIYVTDAITNEYRTIVISNRDEYTDIYYFNEGDQIDISNNNINNIDFTLSSNSKQYSFNTGNSTSLIQYTKLTVTTSGNIYFHFINNFICLSPLWNCYKPSLAYGRPWTNQVHSWGEEKSATKNLQYFDATSDSSNCISSDGIITTEDYGHAAVVTAIYKYGFYTFTAPLIPSIGKTSNYGTLITGWLSNKIYKDPNMKISESGSELSMISNLVDTIKPSDNYNYRKNDENYKEFYSLTNNATALSYDGLKEYCSHYFSSSSYTPNSKFLYQNNGQQTLSEFGSYCSIKKCTNSIRNMYYKTTKWYEDLNRNIVMVGNVFVNGNWDCGHKSGVNFGSRYLYDSFDNNIYSSIYSNTATTNTPDYGVWVGDKEWNGSKVKSRHSTCWAQPTFGGIPAKYYAIYEDNETTSKEKVYPESISYTWNAGDSEVWFNHGLNPNNCGDNNDKYGYLTKINDGLVITGITSFDMNMPKNGGEKIFTAINYNRLYCRLKDYPKYIYNNWTYFSYT